MNKIFSFLLMVFALGFQVASAELIPVEKLLSQLASEEAFCKQIEGQKEEAIMEAVQKKLSPHDIILVKKGLEVPMKLNVNSELIELKQDSANSLTVTVQKDLYFKLSESNLLVSDDLETWKSFSTFFTGMLFAGYSYGQKDLCFDLGLEVHKRTLTIDFTSEF